VNREAIVAVDPKSEAGGGGVSFLKAEQLFRALSRVQPHGPSARCVILARQQQPFSPLPAGGELPMSRALTEVIGRDAPGRQERAGVAQRLAGSPRSSGQ